MALARNWSTQSQDVPYVGSLKQGTGWNPVHAIRAGEGRNIAPAGTSNLVDPDLVSDVQYGYSAEDMNTYGPAESGWETGTYDRPSWDDTEGTRAAVTEDYPSWGPGREGVPKGTVIRSVEHGAIAANTPTQIPNEDVAQGWLNKVNGRIAEPGEGISDPNQYTMQTSMQQLNRTRVGSQRGGGSASPYDQPITTRVVGQKLKYWSGMRRHYDMAPKIQDVIVRPFWLRNAGTGYTEWLDANSMYVSEPLNRTAPADPYQGPPTPTPQDQSYGYTGEDVTY